MVFIDIDIENSGVVDVNNLTNNLHYILFIRAVYFESGASPFLKNNEDNDEYI